MNLSENLKEREMEDVCVDERIILKRILEGKDAKLWAGVILPRIETSSGLLS
jgi:hypothetical protein